MKNETQINVAFEQLGKEFEFMFEHVKDTDIDDTDARYVINQNMALLIAKRDALLWVLGSRNQI